MTRKHFEAFATALAEVRPPVSDHQQYEGWRDAVLAVARVCRDQNPAFRTVQFVSVCEAR